jgi:hypothetical protein
MNVVYQLYSHNPVQDVNTGGIPIPSASDELIYTSGSVSLNNSNGFSFSEIKQLPNPYCCVDPWTQYSYFVKITSPDFQNILLTNVVEPGCAALPIKLKTFTAVRNKANVTLSWVTELEENNKGFEIQRLSGSGNWQTVGFVNTSAVNGNSSIPLNYGFTETNNTKGISQYRLKEVDLSNKHFYSPIRSVRGDGQKTMLIIYPNPSTNGKINIIFEEAVATRDVSVIDINGRVIKMWKGITNNNLQVENLNPGLYSVRIVDAGSGEQTVEKFVIKNR